MLFMPTKDSVEMMNTEEIDLSYILRGTSGDGSVRIFAADSTQLVEEARRIHCTSPTATAALGRALTASSILGVMMKGEGDKLTLMIKGGGPIGSIVCVSDAKGRVKGYVSNPQQDAPPKYPGKLDVGAVVGNQGSLTIIKDLGLKEPYSGSYPLVNGEIAEDLTAYLAYSEQQPSAVALGVLVSPDSFVSASGGMIVQLLPEASEESVAVLERNIAQISSISYEIEAGKTPEDIIQMVLKELEPKIFERTPIAFCCDCSRKKIEEVFIALGKKELSDIIEQDGKAEVVCHFCNTGYRFSKEELQGIGAGLL